MNEIICAVHDEQMNLYNKPVCFRNEATAMRSFGDLVDGDKDSVYRKHPASFGLYKLGYINYETGKITCEPIPTLLCRPVDFIKE